MNMNLPLISVIMPSYNSVATVERAIVSIMDQSYPNTEVIVVDNSSADDTANVVREVAGRYQFENASGAEPKSRIRLLVQPNKGVSSARNEGIKLAEGEYFVSLDSDDYYEPDTIEKLYKALTEQDADVSIGGMRKVYEDNPSANAEFVPDKAFSGSLREFMDSMFLGLYDLHLISTHSNKLYKTELIRSENIYYNEELAVNEDIDFVLRYLRVCRRAAVVPEVFLNYVQHKTGQSLINTFQPHGLKGALIVLENCDKLMGDSHAGCETVRAMDDRLFVHICSFAGLMYYRSNYSDEKKLDEIRKLCGNQHFQILLHRMQQKGVKNRIAGFLLKHEMAKAYHRMCCLIYRNKI